MGILPGYSGYILIPQYSSSKKWNTLAGGSLILCGLGILGIMIWRIYPKLFLFTICLLKKNDKESSE
jgi:hypothetical protein